MDKSADRQYTEFKLKNRTKVNRYLNVVMWFFVITGPAIALGVLGGVFHNVSYLTCFYISAMMAVLSAIHLVLVKKIPTSTATSIFALTALNVLLVYMACVHVSLHLTWFLVPLLSLLFCDRFIFFYAVGVYYVLMVLTTWVTAPFYAMTRTGYTEPAAYFTGVIS
jgi:hypothetical protein